MTQSVSDPLSWLLDDPDLILVLDSFGASLLDDVGSQGPPRGWVTQYGYFEHDWSFSAEQRLTVLDHFEQLHKAMERVLYYGFGILCNHNILWARTQLVTFGVIERVISDDIGILWKVKQQVHHELRPVTHKCVLRFMRGLRATRAM